MLQSLWYMLVLLVQVLQTDPNIRPDKLQFEVYAGSVPALTLSMRGTMVQGSFVDADTRKNFGEFESTKRIPQTFVIFPSQELNDELSAGLAEGGKDSSGSGAAGAGTGAGSAKTGTAKTGNTSSAEPDLSPFTLDFTKALKLLKSFKTTARQRIPFTEAEKLLGGDKSTENGKTGTVAKGTTAGTSAMSASPSPSMSPSPSASASPGSPAASPSPSPSPDAGQQIEIRVFPNRIVLSADFMQLVIIVTYK